MTTMTTPLQDESDAFNARGTELIPAEIRTDLFSPVIALRHSGAAGRALTEGMQAPDFTLPDARGGSVTLSELLHEGPAVITFYRGEWCPYCNMELRAYQRALPQLQALSASLVAISPQTPDHSLSMAERNELAFPVLSDVGNAVARRYGLVFTIDPAVRATYEQVGANVPAHNGEDSWELPIPGTFVVDQAGIIRLAFVDPDFTRRLDPSLVIVRLHAHTGALR